MTKKNKKKLGKVAKKKYAKFSKKEETPKIKTFRVSKEEREKAEKSLSISMKVLYFLKDHKNRKTFRRFCKTCRKKTIHNRTKDNGIVCSRCGFKVGGDGKVDWKEKL